MLTDDASVESSVMDLGMTTTGSSLEGREGIVGGSVSSVRMVVTPMSEKRISSAPAGDEGSLNDFDDEEEEAFKLLEPERRSHVGSLNTSTRPEHVTSSKIDWGQDAVLSPSKSKMSAAQLAGMVMKQKAEEIQQLNDLETRLENPRPLTGSMTGRLDTPNVNFDRITDSPSPDKMGRMGVDVSAETGDIEAVPVDIKDRADQVFDVYNSEQKRGQEEGREEGLDDESDIVGGDGPQLDLSEEIKDDLSAGEGENSSSGSPIRVSPGNKKNDASNPVSPEVGIISDNGVVVDTRPIVAYHGKSGHFTEGVLQQFPLVGVEGSPSGSPVLGGSASGILQSSKSFEVLGSESLGSLSATSGVFGSGLGTNIIKPIRGSSLTTSVNVGMAQSSVNILLERFVEKEKENREKELAMSLKQAEGQGHMQGLALEASSMMPGLEMGAANGGSNDGGSVSTAGTNRSAKTGGSGAKGSVKSHVTSVNNDTSSRSVTDSAVGSSIEIDFRLPALPAAVSTDMGQLSDRSSLNSVSQTTTDENPLRRITLQPEASVNHLYDSSQREALAMFYLNEQGSKMSLNDDDSLSSTGADGLIAYRVHNRIMGWKLTTPKKRRQLLGMLNSVHELNRPAGAEGSHASTNFPNQAPTMRQAQAWGDAVNRMHRARDRTPQGYFKKIMKDKAEQAGQMQRGSDRPGSVQSRLIAETDKAGLHRAIRDGLTTMESEVFLEQVREKSRERSRQMSRQKSASNVNTSGNTNSKANERRAKAKQQQVAVATGRESLGSRGFVEGPVTSWGD